MPNKMERFTQRARRVLSLAQEEAEKFQHHYIGPEHMLIGLIREDGGVASRVLRDLGLELQRVIELVTQLTKAPEQPAQLDLTPDTKRVLELSVDEARRMGHHYIGTEHLLLGLVRQSQSAAIDALKACGVSPEEVRRQTRRVLQEAPVQGAPPKEEKTNQPARQLPARAAEITERELLLLNASDLVEVAGGEVITTTSNRFAYGAVRENLYVVLRAFAKAQDLGYVAMDNLIYVLLKKEQQVMESRIPDLSFIRKERLSGYDSGIFQGAPNLSVEFVSPSKNQGNIVSRVRDYQAHGTEESWVIYLDQVEIYIYQRDSPNSIRVVRAGDTLESTLFPGLKISVGEIFKPAV